MKKILLIISIFFLIGCESSFWDKVNPDIIATVDNYKIRLSEVKKRIRDENEGVKITKPILLFYIKEMIKERIIDDEFKKLKFKITKEELKNANFLDKLNKDELERYIKFKKVKDYITRKVTPPSEKQCKSFYKKNIKKFNHDERVKVKYIIINNEKEAKKIFEEAKITSIDKTIKKYKLKYNFNGIVKITSIPDDIKKQVNFEKENSLWLVKSETDHFYIIYIIKYFNNPIPFEEVREKISSELLEEKRKKLFDLWIKRELKKRNIVIYYNKI